MLSVRFLLTSIVFALLSFPVIAWAWFDHLNDGDGWRQGDWLINFGDGPIRRGLIGEGLIAVSDATDINLLITTQIIQVLLFVAVVIVLWLIALRHSRPLLVALFGLSPAFFLTFFAANPMGSMRKEYFGVLALALLALASLTHKRSLTLPIIAVAIYTLGCIGNILHSLMLPMFLTGLYLLYTQKQLTKRSFDILVLTAAAMATFWLGYAFRFKEITDLAAICAPLQARGFDAAFCDHAIRWLVTGEVDHTAQLLQRLTPVALAQYAVVAVLCLAPLWLALGIFAQKRTVLLLALICFVPLLPLYVTATDWGRWLSLSYTATVLLIVQAQAAERLQLVQLPSWAVVAGLVCPSLLMAHEHTLGWQPGGAVGSVVQNIRNFM